MKLRVVISDAYGRSTDLPLRAFFVKPTLPEDNPLDLADEVMDIIQNHFTVEEESDES